jgi:hypothetical protein
MKGLTILSFYLLMPGFFLPLITATALKALDNNHNTGPKCENDDTLYLIDETSTSHPTNKRQSTSPSASNSHRPSHTRGSHRK